MSAYPGIRWLLAAGALAVALTSVRCSTELRERGYHCTSDSECAKGHHCDAARRICVACGCDGRECGDDGCGTDCGSCDKGLVCGELGWCVFQSCASAYTTMVTCAAPTCILDAETGPAVSAPFCADTVNATVCQYKADWDDFVDPSMCLWTDVGVLTGYLDCNCAGGGTVRVWERALPDASGDLWLDQKLWVLDGCQLGTNGAMSGDICWTWPPEVWESAGVGIAVAERISVAGCPLERDYCWLGETPLLSYPLPDGTRCHVELPQKDGSTRVYAGTGIYACQLYSDQDVMRCVHEADGDTVEWPAGCAL